METIEQLKKDLEKLSDPIRAQHSMGFFKTAKGQYGEGDVFIGVKVPDQRKIAKKYKELSLSEVKNLIYSEVHEHRLIALFILVDRFQRALKKNEINAQKEVVDFYVAHIERVNNWDLVDSSAHKILGAYLYENEKDRKILYDFAKTDHLWKQRVAIIATMYFSDKHDFGDVLGISEMLLDHEHDLIHKAVGWLLREVGKKDMVVEEQFLKKYYKKMPRTMLRYAIEKFPEKKRQDYLKGRV